MQNSKLIRLLKLLDEPEFKDFPKFINSPFFNSNKNFLPFYQYLKKYYPTFDSPKLTKEKVFQKLFPTKKYNYNIISNLMSHFANLTENYMTHLQFQKEQRTQKKLLVKNLSSRKDAYEIYQKYHENLVSEIQHQGFQNADYFHDLQTLSHEFFYHPVTNRHNNRLGGIQTAMENLDLYFSKLKLQYCLEMKGRAYLFEESFETKFSKELLFESEDFFAAADPISLIYLKIYQAFDDFDNISNFKTAKQLFFQHINKIDTEEKSILLLHLLNYSIRQANKGAMEFSHESLALYKVGLSDGLFIEQNRMAEVTYSNIVSTGVKCMDFEWTEKFISDFKSFLDEENREDAFLLSLAVLAFYRKDYSKSSRLILNHSFQKTLNIIKAKTLLIRCQFEQFLIDDSYFEVLIAQTYSFEKYLRRSTKVSSGKSTPFLNFLQLVRKISTGILEKNLHENIIHEIKNTSSLSYKSWLLEKVN